MSLSRYLSECPRRSSTSRRNVRGSAGNAPATLLKDLRVNIWKSQKVSVQTCAVRAQRGDSGGSRSATS
eukprot:CAMPEP_0119340828 /NCGR_PEP_ID=MMETSP1333-20130426/101090_1 /TAXON_ID=418940 /ORGANISM="Scyphosphaera apsteinii, Strain RCC1455" /LENGTH=68 /DNA_ID=CAMNT_0007352665 /DNA_START=402 /DNA_END=604 /DNA_ORIENTATION=+